MNWTERLNRELGQMPLGAGTVEFLQWAYECPLPDNRPHRHTFFEICQVGAQGAGLFLVQEEPHPVGPGDLFIARPGVIHQIVNTGAIGLELRWVSFQWTPGKAGKSDGGDADALMRAFSSSPLLVIREGLEVVSALWSALEASAGVPASVGSEDLNRVLASALVLALCQAGTEHLSAPEAGRQDVGDLAGQLAVRFIQDNLSRPLTTAEIAAQVHLSPRHLSRVFARFTGKSPAHYLSHARMDRARGLLVKSALPIKEIAATVGYPDVHHFTRVFAAHFGSPPGEVRRHPERCGVPNIQNPGDLV